MKKTLRGVIFPNKDGVFENTLSKEKVQPNWLEAAEEFIDYFNTYNDTNIHSVYLRGSVANSTEIDFFSDIDFYVITLKPVSDFDFVKIKKYADKLNNKYPFISRFDIGYFIKDQIVQQKEGFLLKLTALCMYGNDIRELIPASRLGGDMILSISQLEHDIIKIKSEAVRGFYDDPEKLKSLCVWISKKIIRSGFDLVAVKEQCFTRNLISCHTIFSKYYPDQSEAMQEVMDLFIYHTKNISQVLLILEGIGSWLIYEYKKSPESIPSGDY